MKMNETSSTEGAEAGRFVVSKQVHVSAASASFSELREDIMENQRPLPVDLGTQHNGQGRTQSLHYSDLPSLPVVGDWFGLAVEICHNSRREFITDLLKNEVSR